MAVDLRGRESRRSTEMVIESDSLVLLGQESMSRDRLRRILFARVSRVLVWQVYPWFLISVVVFFMLLSALLLYIPEVGVYLFGFSFVVLLLILARYLVWKKSFIRIDYLGESCTITTFQRPGKVRRFIQKLRTAIDECQTREHAQLQQNLSAPATPPPLPPAG